MKSALESLREYWEANRSRHKGTDGGPIVNENHPLFALLDMLFETYDEGSETP